MDTELAAWLRQERENRGWPKAEMARRLVQAGRDAGDNTVPSVSGMLHNIHRWEREGGVSERHKLHYCRALAIQPGQFGNGTRQPNDAVAPPSPAEVSPAAPAAVVPVQRPAAAPVVPGLPQPALAGIAYRGKQELVPGEFAVGQEVMTAAHEGSDHAAEHSTNARASRARSARPASVTVSRTVAPAITAPAFPAAIAPGSHAGRRADTPGWTPDSGANVKARAPPERAPEPPSSGYPHRSLAPIPVRHASVDTAT